MMNKRPGRYLLLTALLLLFLFSGCAVIYGPSTFQKESVTPEYLRSYSQHQYQKIRTLEGWAKITVKSAQQGFSADTHILLKQPDSLFFKIEAAFGIDVGLFFADRKQYLLYTPMQNLSYSGPVDSLQNSPFIDLDISYDNLLQSVSGSECVAALENWQLQSGPEEIVLTGSGNGLTYQYTFHPRYGNITSLDVKNDAGDLLVQHQYSRFTRVNGVRVPFHIRIKHPQRKEMFSLFYSEMRINKNIKKDRFKIKLPENVLHLNM